MLFQGKYNGLELNCRNPHTVCWDPKTPDLQRHLKWFNKQGVQLDFGACCHVLNLSVAH